MTLAIPATSFAATTNSHSIQNPTITVSGATAVPQPDPKSGILSGGACAPDVHQFDLGQKMVMNPQTKKPEPNHMAFAVQVAPGANSSKVLTEAAIAKDTTVYVDIYNAGGNFIRRYNVPKNKNPDPDTKNPFFVQCVWLRSTSMATKFGETVLPSGTYTYKFLVSVNDPKVGHIIQKTWTPSDNSFTLVNNANS